MEIMPSSPKAAAVENEAICLPLHELEVGFSGKVPLDFAPEGKLRTYVSRQAKKLGFKLRVVKHNDLGCFEIARIA